MKLGEWHQGSCTFLLNFKEENKAGSVAVVLGFHVPDSAVALRLCFTGDSLGCSDRNPGSPGFPVCLQRAGLGQAVSVDDYTHLF